VIVLQIDSSLFFPLFPNGEFVFVHFCLALVGFLRFLVSSSCLPLSSVAMFLQLVCALEILLFHIRKHIFLFTIISYSTY